MDNGNNVESPPTTADIHPRSETRYRIKKRQQEAETVKQQQVEIKRHKKLFKRRNKRINPNDIIVDKLTNKIKFESPENSGYVVKQEQKVDNQDLTSDSDDINKFEEKIVNSEIHLPISYKAQIHHHTEATKIIKNEQEIVNTETHSNNILVDAKNEEYEEIESYPHSDTDNFLIGADMQNKSDDQTQKFEEMEVELEWKNRIINQLRDHHRKSTAVLIKRNQNLQKLLQEQRKETESLRKQLAIKTDQLEKTAEGRELFTGALQEISEVDTDIIFERRVDKPWKHCSPNMKSSFELVLKMYIHCRSGENKFSHVKWDNHISFLKCCRLVCKSWKETVDSLMQQHKSYQNLCRQSLLDLKEKQMKWMPPPLVLQTNDQTASRMEWITYFASLLDNGSISSSYNPIPSRHLMIEGECRSRQKLFSARIETYLDKFGKHVWNLTVIIKTLDVVRNASVLRRLLKHLPNLKCVTIDAGDARGKHVGVSGLDISPNHKLPYLPNLTTLQYRGSTQILPQIIAMNAKNIRRLHLDQKNLSSYYGIIVDKNFPNLSELSLCCYSVDQMNLLRSVGWRLETIRLNFPDAVRTSLSNIFIALETFKDTLKTVTLDCPRVEFSGTGKTYLNLPCVESFNFMYRDRKNVKVHRVFRNLKRIQTLNLTICYGGFKRRRDEIDKYISSLSKNTVFKALPELKDLNIKSTRIVREPWSSTTPRMQLAQVARPVFR